MISLSIEDTISFFCCHFHLLPLLYTMVWFAKRNNAPMNIFLQMYICMFIFIYLEDKFLQVELLG